MARARGVVPVEFTRNARSFCARARAVITGPPRDKSGTVEREKTNRSNLDSRGRVIRVEISRDFPRLIMHFGQNSKISKIGHPTTIPVENKI